MSSKKKAKPPTKAATVGADVKAEQVAEQPTANACVADDADKKEAGDLCLSSPASVDAHVSFRMIQLGLPDLPIGYESKLVARVECSFKQYCAATLLVKQPIVASVSVGGANAVFAAKDLSVIGWKAKPGDRITAIVIMAVTEVFPRLPIHQ